MPERFEVEESLRRLARVTRCEVEDIDAENGVRAALICAAGRRKYMEEFSRILKVKETKRLRLDRGILAITGVFDGHGGDRVSKFVANNIGKAFLKRLLAEDELPEVSNEEQVAWCVEKAFRDTDQKIFNKPIEIRTSHGDLYYDRGEWIGSTCSAVVVMEDHLVAAHVGDSRIVVVRDGDIVYESRDHVPTDPAETARINGSSIAKVENGSLSLRKTSTLKSYELSVSRAFGDYMFKNDPSVEKHEQPVICDPEVQVIDRDKERDEFVIIASDGLFHFMETEDVVKWVRHRLCVKRMPVEKCVEALLDYCFIRRRSDDNISILLIKF